MAATYNPFAITSDVISYGRLLFQDKAGLSGTTVGKPLLLDEEYQGFIDALGARLGLAACAIALASSFAQKVQSYAESGGIDVTWPRRPEFYLKLADDIRTNGVGEFEDGAGGVLGYSTPLPTPCTDERLASLTALP